MTTTDTMRVDLYNPDFPIDALITWLCTIGEHRIRVGDVESIVALAHITGASIMTSDTTLVRTMEEHGIQVQHG